MTQTQENQHTQSSQQPQQPQGQWQDQPDFSTTFAPQIVGGTGMTPDTQIDWAREYFDQADRSLRLVEEQLRSARRVSEISAVSQIRHQIVAQCAQLVRQQVLSDLRREYSLTQMQQSQQPQQSDSDSGRS